MRGLWQWMHSRHCGENSVTTWSPSANIGDALADRLDDARALVPEHGRRIAGGIDARGRVQVGVADAAGDEPHEHLARPRLGEVELLHDQRLGELLEQRRADPSRRRLPQADRSGRSSAASRHPGLRERRDLQLVRGRARALLGQVQHGLGEARADRPAHRADAPARAAPLSGSMPASTISSATWMPCGRSSSAAACVIARTPNAPAAHSPRPGIARRAEPPVTWISVAVASCSTR